MTTLSNKVGEKIGKPIKIDEATSLVSRDHFGRMCVEVDLEKPLIFKFEHRRKVRRFEYEGIHLIYFNCGKFNHKKEECPMEQQSGIGVPEKSCGGNAGIPTTD